MNTRVLNRYDHRLRELVHSTADSTIARKNGVPRSTAAGWIKNKPRTVVSTPALALNPTELQQEVVQLRSLASCKTQSDTPIGVPHPLPL